MHEATTEIFQQRLQEKQNQEEENPETALRSSSFRSMRLDHAMKEHKDNENTYQYVQTLDTNRRNQK
jgi:hypothetical protein